jgi:hypothetical protein
MDSQPNDPSVDGDPGGGGIDVSPPPVERPDADDCASSV